jgi:hypothetical protein
MNTVADRKSLLLRIFRKTGFFSLINQIMEDCISNKNDEIQSLQYLMIYVIFHIN